MTIYFHRGMILLTKIITLSVHFIETLGLPADSVVKNPACQCRGHRFIPGRESLTSRGATKARVPQLLSVLLELTTAAEACAL